MKTIFIFLNIWTFSLTAQDTNSVWLRRIDSLDFKLYYTKNYIPKDLYKYLEINRSEIANPDEEYSLGCVRKKGVPSTKLNWIAKDNKNHFIVSISIGGWAHRTLYFFLDKKKKDFNINELSFGHDSRNLTIGEVEKRILNKTFEFEEVKLTED